MRRLIVLALLALGALTDDGIAAQSQADRPPEIRVRVEQVAGSAIYLDIGTTHGLAAGDTVLVFTDELRAPLGQLLVRLANNGRSVLDYVQEPFGLENGQIIRIQLLRMPDTPAPDPNLAVSNAQQRRQQRIRAAAGATTATDREPASDSASSVQADKAPVSGRWAMDFAGQHSLTELGGGVGDTSVSRLFASPALRFDLFAPESLAGFDLRLRTRATYRYGSSPGFDSRLMPRFYEVSLERSFDALPLQLTIGRFHSPGESFSGYWDGVSARVGSPSFGVGVLAGLQPDRWNQMPNGDLPKASVYAEFDRRVDDMRWRGDVSVHAVWPRSGIGTHSFFGAGHQLSRGGFRLDQQIQVDRDRWGGGFALSRFTTRATIRMSPGVNLRAGVSRRSTFLLWQDNPAELFAPSRDRVNIGVSARSGARSGSLDVALNRDAGGQVSQSASGSFSSGTLWRGMSAMASFSYWNAEQGDSWSVAPAVRWTWGSVQGRTGYRFYSSTFARRTQTTHSPDVTLSTRLPNGLRASARIQGRFGQGVMSEYVQFSISRIF